MSKNTVVEIIFGRELTEEEVVNLTDLLIEAIDKVEDDWMSTTHTAEFDDNGDEVVNEEK